MSVYCSLSEEVADALFDNKIEKVGIAKLIVNVYLRMGLGKTLLTTGLSHYLVLLIKYFVRFLKIDWCSV